MAGNWWVRGAYGDVTKVCFDGVRISPAAGARRDVLDSLKAVLLDASPAGMDFRKFIDMHPFGIRDCCQ